MCQDKTGLAAYADEYVNWLTALTPAFIANSTAIAQDDANNQYAATEARQLNGTGPIN